MRDNKPMANPNVVMREESDEWAILFEPDSAEGYTINPVGVFIWKRLDGQHTIGEIAMELKEHSDDSPEIDRVESDCQNFIEDLVKQGLAGYEVKEGRRPGIKR